VARGSFFVGGLEQKAQDRVAAGLKHLLPEQRMPGAGYSVTQEGDAGRALLVRHAAPDFFQGLDRCIAILLRAGELVDLDQHLPCFER
jgi:hypothetical protein